MDEGGNHKVAVPLQASSSISPGQENSRQDAAQAGDCCDVGLWKHREVDWLLVSQVNYCLLGLGHAERVNLYLIQPDYCVGGNRISHLAYDTFVGHRTKN